MSEENSKTLEEQIESHDWLAVLSLYSDHQPIGEMCLIDDDMGKIVL